MPSTAEMSEPKRVAVAAVSGFDDVINEAIREAKNSNGRAAKKSSFSSRTWSWA